MINYTVKLSIEDSEGVVQYESRMTKEFIDNIKKTNISPLDQIFGYMQDLMKSADPIINPNK